MLKLLLDLPGYSSLLPLVYQCDRRDDGAQKLSQDGAGLAFTSLQLKCKKIFSTAVKMSEPKMFDRTKPPDRDSESPLTGRCCERMSTEGSTGGKNNGSLKAQTKELPGPGASGANRLRGYCSLCRKHYSRLEQHLRSLQHRHFVTYNRNHLSSGTLMERFLHDVRLCHPQSYHDNRPTYDDLPYTQFLPTPREDLSAVKAVCLHREEDEETLGTRSKLSATDIESVVESCTSSPCKTKSSSAKASGSQLSTCTQVKRRKPKCGIYQQQITCSSIKISRPSDCVRTSDQKAFFTAVRVLPRSPIRKPLPQTSHGNPQIAKNSPCSLKQEIPVSKHSPGNVDICSGKKQLDTCPTPLVSHQKLGCVQGNSSHLTSGLSVWKHASLKSQGEPSEDHLRNISHTGFTCHQPSVYLGKGSKNSSKAVDQRGSYETYIDEIIEDVILKHCYGILPTKMSCQEMESHSPVHIKTLLDNSNTEGSDISFNLETPFQPAVGQSKAAKKDLDLLKEAHVTLQDGNYESHLCSVLNISQFEVTEDLKSNTWTHSEEPILPALPHVPPSFVGKTWSQIMHEDDLKIEALVRDFREGRFHCYFDSDSLASGQEKRSREIKKPKSEGCVPVTDSWPEIASANALPAFSDDISEAPDSVHPSVASKPLCKPSSVKIPAKRTWRLASRCQTVKVSHGTQTSLLNYPVVKHKTIRQDSEMSERPTKFDWLENERTPDMKTRLCTLKLPASYTKILSPMQPKNMVYVLSHPDMDNCKGKPAGISRSQRNRYSTDSKNSVTYKYKQSPLKYYDPLTNRILKMLPSSPVRGKMKRSTCARQLFRSLSLDVNMATLDDLRKESPASKKYFHSTSSTPVCTTKNPIAKVDGPSNSTETLGSPTLGEYVKTCSSLVLSPLNAKLTTLATSHPLPPRLDRTGTASESSIKSHLLKRENPKTKRRKLGTMSETTLSKLAPRAISVRRGMAQIRGNVSTGKPSHRTKKQSKERLKKTRSTVTKTCTQDGQTRQRSCEKRLARAKTESNKLLRVRHPRKAPLKSPDNSSVSLKQARTSKPVCNKTDKASSKVKRHTVQVRKVLPRATKRTTNRVTVAH